MRRRGGAEVLGPGGWMTPTRLVLAAAAARTLPSPSFLPRRDARVVERPSTVAW
jgi:hypothetical protein